MAVKSRATAAIEPRLTPRICTGIGSTFTIDLGDKEVAGFRHQPVPGFVAQIRGVVNPDRNGILIIGKLHDEARGMAVNNKKTITAVIGNQKFWQPVKVGSWAHGVTIYRLARLAASYCARKWARPPTFQKIFRDVRHGLLHNKFAGLNLRMTVAQMPRSEIGTA